MVELYLHGVMLNLAQRQYYLSLIVYPCVLHVQLLTFSLTDLLPHSMVQDILLKADSHSACQKIACFLCGIRRFITVLTKPRHRTLS
jgi:hypothetical protein